jgi:hypothetical protein
LRYVCHSERSEESARFSAALRMTVTGQLHNALTF